MPSTYQPEGREDKNGNGQEHCGLKLAARFRSEIDRPVVGMDGLRDPDNQQHAERREDDEPASAVDQTDRDEQHTCDGQRLKQQQKPPSAIADRQMAESPDEQAAAKDRGC